ASPRRRRHTSRSAISAAPRGSSPPCRPSRPIPTSARLLVYLVGTVGGGLAIPGGRAGRPRQAPAGAPGGDLRVPRHRWRVSALLQLHALYSASGRRSGRQVGAPQGVPELDAADVLEGRAAAHLGGAKAAP